MVSTKDVVIIPIVAAIYVVFTLFSAVFTTGPFIFIFFPTIFLVVFPIWFGIPGILGIMLGDLLQASIIKGFGLLGVINPIGYVILFAVWALTPAGLGISSLIPMIENGMIDWIVATGANLYHDTHFGIGLRAGE